MVTFSANFPELLETRQKDIFFKWYSMQELQYPTVFDTKNSTTAFEDRIDIEGLGTLQTKAEGTPVAFSDPVQGTRRRTVHATFALGYRHTMEALQDDQWSILDKMPADLGDSARDHKERLAWALVSNGFGTTNTGLDGLALFSASHTTPSGRIGTQSNLLAPAVALSVSGLESLMTQARTIQTNEGRFANIEQSKLVYHPANEHNAKVLMRTEQRPGTADNDISTVSSTESGITPARTQGVPYLSSETAWFLFDRPGRNTLQFNDRMATEFFRARDADTFDQKHYVAQRNSVMFSEWRGAFGSNAS